MRGACGWEGGVGCNNGSAFLKKDQKEIFREIGVTGQEFLVLYEQKTVKLASRVDVLWEGINTIY